MITVIKENNKIHEKQIQEDFNEMRVPGEILFVHSFLHSFTHIFIEHVHVILGFRKEETVS